LAAKTAVAPTTSKQDAQSPQECNRVPDIIGFCFADDVFVGVAVKANWNSVFNDRKQFLI
jgi:hypothetical protein